ncbi:CoA binding domain-containing protein [Mycena haematopus]|nr:CoA binding domain-containing protein [Mycena haematopus]
MPTPAVQAAPTLEQKEALFLSAPHFAVVGASTSESKNGTKALNWLIKENKDVVPVNLNAPEIHGIKCKKSLSELPDPTHTSVSIVVPPKATLDVLKLAKSLGIYAVWIQPGAEDDAVVEFIEADAQFKARCIYREHALHTATSPKILLAANTVHSDILGPCIYHEPPASPGPISSAAPLTTAALAASNVVAGVKHALSPPSTPPAAKSLKLTPDTADLGEEIPGLA